MTRTTGSDDAALRHQADQTAPVPIFWSRRAVEPGNLGPATGVLGKAGPARYWFDLRHAPAAGLSGAFGTDTEG